MSGDPLTGRTGSPTTCSPSRRYAVHRALCAAGPGASVTAIAVQHGFAHLGRFAGEYRARFGESPSTTLRR
ncbi:helix-turn-helix domain-containing protein [Micromonospora purpureochromogenes]|uniref:helix-turn-helix domain-containing protein n=1 Tax=Micromonospora purpureochromogenes TaxID=47872 RepID=UPI0033C2E8CE